MITTDFQKYFTVANQIVEDFNPQEDSKLIAFYHDDGMRFDGSHYFLKFYQTDSLDSIYLYAFLWDFRKELNNSIGGIINGEPTVYKSFVKLNGTHSSDFIRIFTQITLTKKWNEEPLIIDGIYRTLKVVKNEYTWNGTSSNKLLNDFIKLLKIVFDGKSYSFGYQKIK